MVVNWVLLSVLVGIPHLSTGDELLQSLDFAGITDETVAQEVLRSWATVVVLSETLSDEVLEVLAEVALQTGRRVLGDVEENLHGVDVAQRRFSIGHFHGCDTQ